MHFQSSFRIQRNPANIADVLCVVMNVFMGFQPWEVFELFRASLMEDKPMIMNLISKAENFELTSNCTDEDKCRNE